MIKHIFMKGRSSSSQCRSPQAILFTYYSFGCKRWLLLFVSTVIQCHILFSSFCISSCCALLLKFEIMPISWTGCELRSVALHRIQFGALEFVPILYFLSDTNEMLSQMTSAASFVAYYHKLMKFYS